MKANITEERIWTAGDIRDLCVENNLYTAGNNKAYSKMLDFISDNEPTNENIVKVAKDINAHSEENTETNIAYLIINKAVKIFLKF